MSMAAGWAAGMRSEHSASAAPHLRRLPPGRTHVSHSQTRRTSNVSIHSQPPSSLSTLTQPVIQNSWQMQDKHGRFHHRELCMLTKKTNTGAWPGLSVPGSQAEPFPNSKQRSQIRMAPEIVTGPAPNLGLP